MKVYHGAATAKKFCHKYSGSIRARTHTQLESQHVLYAVIHYSLFVY